VCFVCPFAPILQILAVHVGEKAVPTGSARDRKVSYGPPGGFGEEGRPLRRAHSSCEGFTCIYGFLALFCGVCEVFSFWTMGNTKA
jgi:hypothetical protein